MINILNNKLKFKEKYLSFHKNSNVNPKNINNILKKRIKSLYSFSYNLNKFSKNNPTLVLKGLPYLTKGISITETERILKLSPLSRKGLDVLKVTPKAKSSFLYPSSKLSKIISEDATLASTLNLSSQNLKVNTLDLGGIGKNPRLLDTNSTSAKIPHPSALMRESTDGIGGSNLTKSSLMAADSNVRVFKENRLSLAASGLVVNRANAKRLPLQQRERDIETPRYFSTDTGLDLKLKSRLPLLLSLKEKKLASVPLNGMKSEGNLYNGYKKLSAGMYPERLTLSKTNLFNLSEKVQLSFGSAPVHKGYGIAAPTPAIAGQSQTGDLERGSWPVSSDKSLKGQTDRYSKQLLSHSTEKTLNHEMYGTRNNKRSKNLINVWKGEWNKKIIQFSKLGSYKPQVSDKNWFTLLEQIRQIIKSKYNFSPLLSRSQSVNYSFNKNYKKINFNSIYKILKYFFTSLSALISKPVFQFSPDKVNIRLFYYVIPTLLKLNKERKEKRIIRNKGLLYDEKKKRREFRKIMQNFRIRLFIAKWKENNNLIRLPNLPHTFSNFIDYSNQTSKIALLNDDSPPFPAKAPKVGNSLNTLKLKTTQIVQDTMVSLNTDKLKYLVFILEKAFNKSVILDLVRLKYPYHESNILAQVLGLSSNRKNFRQMMRKLLYTATIKNPTKMIRKQNFSIIPSYLSGIKIRLAGRLITQRVVPRFTVQSVQMGSLARGKINYVDSARLTHKNKRGAFSFTVSTSHIFENYK